MELTEIWAAIRRRLWVVILMAVVASGTAYSLCRWYLPKAYAATATLMVIPGPSPGGDYVATLVTGQQMVATYAALAASPAVLTRVIHETPGSPSLTALTQDLTASDETGTNLMTITVKAANPLLAAHLSNAVAHAVTTTVTRVTGQPGIKVVANATPVRKPVSPRKMRTTAEAGALGIVLGVLLSFIWNSLDDVIRREEEVAQGLSCTVLGVISHIPVSGTPARHAASATGSPQRSVSS